VVGGGLLPCFGKTLPGFGNLEGWGEPLRTRQRLPELPLSCLPCGWRRAAALFRQNASRFWKPGRLGRQVGQRLPELPNLPGFRIARL